MRKSLSERMTNDLGRVFFKEFATTHTIDGKEMPVILTQVETEEVRMSYGLMKATLNPKEKQLYRDVWELYVQKKDLERKITPNSTINLDGKNMWVWNIYDTEGLYKILIGRHGV